MEISMHVVKRLEQLAGKGPEQVEAVFLDSTQQKGYIVAVPAEENAPHITITLQDFDRYSIVLHTLEINHARNLVTNGKNESNFLQCCADQIIQRLTYLEEPMTLLELDAEEGLAQLRTKPTRRQNEVIYWEALVQARPHPKATLTHYRWTPDYPEREVLVYPATFAWVGRISADLAMSLSQEA